MKKNNTEKLKSSRKKNVIIVSGLAGSGKSVVIHALEDIGYYCIDNLPSSLLKSLSTEKNLQKIDSEYIAIALDSRDINIPKTFKSIYPKLKSISHLTILFLDASKETILKRFRETRRKHPLKISTNLSLSLNEMIDLDELTLEPIRKLTDKIIHTSSLSSQILKKYIYHNFAFHQKDNQIILNFISFGFKHEVPTDMDSYLDARCFPNPFYEDTLKAKTGVDKEVQQFVLSDANVMLFIKKIIELIEFLYPLYQEEGKKYFSFGIGCTGGKHRSVVIVEELYKYFSTKYELVNLEHRHINED